jgi:DNA-binding PadR family transcriptional regulator
MHTPLYRRPLNPLQVHTLQILYKFRFTTTQTIQSIYANKTYSSVYQSLTILEQQGYITKLYTTESKAMGKYAVYYLSAKGVEALNAITSLSAKTVALLKRNRRQTNARINHYVAVSDLYVAALDRKGTDYDIFTKTELIDFDHYVKSPPDLFLRTKPADAKPIKQYCFDLMQSSSVYHVNRRIDDYMHHFNTTGWEAEFGKLYPAIEILVSDGKTQKASQSYATNRLQILGITDLSITISC